MKRFLCKIVRILIKMSRASCLASSVSLIFRRFNWTACRRKLRKSHFPAISSNQSRMRRIRNFFLFAPQSESYRIWILFASSYSHVSVYSQTPVFHVIRFIFASKYAQNSNTNIRLVAKKIHFLVLANICFKIIVLTRIFAKL
jgi:hypothetical protein